MMSKRIIKAVSYSGLGTLVRQASQITVTIISARIFGPTAMGELAAALAVLSIIQLLGVTGLGASLIKALKIDKVLPTVLTVSVALAGVAALLLTLVWASISTFYHFEFAANWGPAVTAYVALKIFSTVLESILLNTRSFLVLGMLEVCTHIFSLAVFLALLNSFATFDCVFYFYIVQALTSTTALVWICRDKIRFSFDAQIFKEILRFSIPYSASQVGSAVAANADNLLIGKLLGNIALGYYSRAYQLLVAPAALVGQVVQRIAFSYLSHANDPSRSSRNFLGSATLPMGLVGFQCAAVCWFYSNELVTWIYGTQWGVTAEVLAILSLSMFFRLHYKLLEPLVFAIGSAARVSKYTTIYAALVTSVTIYFGFFGSIYLIACGVALSIVAYWTLLYIDVRRLVAWTGKEELAFAGAIFFPMMFCFGFNYIFSLSRLHWAVNVSISTFAALIIGILYFARNQKFELRPAK